MTKTLTLERETRPVVPTEEDIKLAQESTKKFAALSSAENSKAHYVLWDKQSKIEVEISQSMFVALLEVMKGMAQGKAIMLTPLDAELTTQQVADLLNVSRPYVVKLLDDNQIPSRTVGRYRRVRFEDLRNYQLKIETDRQEALNELAAQSQELGLE
jgi:excisionase family DNA binding protein